MVESTRTPAFKPDACTSCGTCFNECPVLQLPIEGAKGEIKKLIDQQDSIVLANCNTCFSCNTICEQGANPYQLILENWNRLYKTRRAPPLYKFVCPTEEPNIWQLLNLFLSPRERQWIDSWMNYEPQPGDTVLLVGNYTHLFPFIIGGSKLLENFKPIDRIDQWEGGAYLYQGGYLDVVKRIAEKTKRDFDGWKVKKVVAFLDAVHYIFTEVHPKEMGVKHDQEFQKFNKWLLDEIESDRVELPNQLEMKVTVHDNCYSKTQNGVQWDVARDILEKCGCTIVEMEHSKKDSLCCGFGAGASWVNNMAIPFDILSEGLNKFREAKQTGADALVSYCGGCIYLLWAAKELFNIDIDVYHLVELVRMSMGEKLNYPEDNVNRAWDVITIITYQLMLSLLEKPFWIRKISYDSKRSTFKPGRALLLRFMRKLFDLRFLRKIYRKMFYYMIPLMKKKTI
ncbi:MAG: (Fe-S)-binding protein [Candidatus Hodarchaeota archaeon]